MGSPISKAQRNLSSVIKEEEESKETIIGKKHKEYGYRIYGSSSSSSSSKEKEKDHTKNHTKHHRHATNNTNASFIATKNVSQERRIDVTETENYLSTLNHAISPTQNLRRRRPIINISSSSSSDSSQGSPSPLTLSKTPSLMQQDNIPPKTKLPCNNLISSQDDQFINTTCNKTGVTSSCFNNYSGDEDLSGCSEKEDHVVYDWLQTDSSRYHNPDTGRSLADFDLPISPPIFSPTSTRPYSTTTAKKMNQRSNNKITFTPPGWDSPLGTANSSANINSTSTIFPVVAETDKLQKVRVIDTNKVQHTNARLPEKKPEVTQGNWLTNRLVVNNYIVLQCIGKGSFGEVRLCKEKQSNELFAIKIIKRAGDELDALKMEIAIMKQLRHENCVCLYEVMDDPNINKLYLVMEYMKGGDLMKVVNKSPMDDSDVWDIARQVIRGLKYLHDNNIIHGDLKPQNLLVSVEGLIKIADFGLSKIIHDNELLREYIGTPAFMGPEIICGDSFDGKVADFYSVGATLYYIRFGKPPFNGKNLSELYFKIQNHPISFPCVIAMGVEQLMIGLMAKLPSERLTMIELLTFPWLQQRPDEILDFNAKNIFYNETRTKESGRQ